MVVRHYAGPIHWLRVNLPGHWRFDRKRCKEDTAFWVRDDGLEVRRSYALTGQVGPLGEELVSVFHRMDTGEVIPEMEGLVPGFWRDRK